MFGGRLRALAVACAAAILVALLPVRGLALSAPRTLAYSRSLGQLAGTPAPVDPPFPVDYLGVSWIDGGEPGVRFLIGGRWTAWFTAHIDDFPVIGERTFSALIAGKDADRFQLRGRNTGLKAVAINTTDGPRGIAVGRRFAMAAHLAQPPVISRAGWAADESFRFNSDGTEKWPPAFYPTQKLIVHHTATQNSDPDPAATVRAIYRYHAIDKGWGDIGYNFLVDGQGRIYKGRYSGAPGTRDQDTSSGENSLGYGVTAAHAAGYNSGTMGIAILGTYSDGAIPTAARSALVDDLAWESDRHGLDPLAVTPYTNPVSGAQKVIDNISGHRDWVATECPGESFHRDLPSIRHDVAAKVSATPPAPDTTAPTAPVDLTATAGKRKVSLSWTASTDSGSGLAGYEIWRSTSAAGTFLKIATTASTSYANRGLTRGKTYWYYVVAQDRAANRSAPSNTVSAKVL